MEWMHWLLWVEYYFNTSHHSSTHTTPFKIVYERDPPPLTSYEACDSTPNYDLDLSLKQRDVMLDELKN